MRWFERLRMAILMLFRRESQTARLNATNCSFTSISRSRRISLADLLRTRRVMRPCARSAILRCSAIKRCPVGAGTGWKNFCAIYALARAPSAAHRDSQPPPSL